LKLNQYGFSRLVDDSGKIAKLPRRNNNTGALD
jgi:hypothetical protein